MELQDDRLFKICVSVPEEFLERIMDSVNDNMEPVYPGYDRAFSYSRTTGTWRPLEGSNPFKGELNRIEVADEIRLEFVIKGKDIRNVLRAIADIHPYEEPAMDVSEVKDWKDLV